jgi:glucan phosphoethanolaminetransferase (alkaline phosphatase superfamily)
MAGPVAPKDYGRDESRAERMDRNWSELLQELRVLQTGVQLLAGFLLTLPFQSRFETLDGYQTSLYLANVVLAALTTATILLPVSVHRRLFRQGLKATLVASADAIMKVSLAGVGLLSVGTTSLIFDVTLGRAAGLIAGLGLLAVLVLLLVFVPSALRRKGRGEGPA